MENYRIYKIDAQTIIKCVELYGKFKDVNNKADYTKIADGLGIHTRKAREALKAAEELKLLNTSSKFVSASPEEQKLLFRKALQSFKPFVDFIFFLEKGDTPDEAVRKIKSLYNVERNPKDILWVFKKWGTFADIFLKDTFELANELKNSKPSMIGELLLQMDNELKAKLWLAKVLGDAKKYITNEEHDSLTEAILHIQKNPRRSVQSAGEVLEDYLRKIANDRNIDVSKKNGIFQIAEELSKNGVIASKHVPILKGLQVFLDRDIFDGLAAFRNMAHHGKDKKEMKKWELSEELALSYVIQVVLCIKSLYYYLIEEQLTF